MGIQSVIHGMEEGVQLGGVSALRGESVALAVSSFSAIVAPLFFVGSGPAI